MKSIEINLKEAARDSLFGEPFHRFKGLAAFLVAENMEAKFVSLDLKGYKVIVMYEEKKDVRGNREV